MEPLELHHDEKVRLDADRLARLYIDLGAAGAEAVLCNAMEELAVRLARIERSRHEDDVEQIVVTAEAITVVAERIGLRALASVSQDVVTSAARVDHAALAATLARLARTGDRSLSAIWDPQDLSV